MEDIFLSIVTKIAEYMVDPILHQAKYLCCFNNFASNLPNAKQQLEMTRDRVKERAKEAHNRTEKLEPTVEKWLEDVENVLEEVQLLEGRISEVNKSYFKRQCQYFLAKEIARKTEEIIQLDRNSKFEPFSRITELPGMKYFSSNNFVLFNSTETAYKQLLEALKDKSCSMIGLVGIGGSGKTTLAKEVGKKVQELKLFEKVAMATVSQTPSITSIQDQIADQLNLYLKEASEIGRAQRLSKTLRNGTTLLILDDVWEKLNFEALGIPFDENTKGCCVLLTTRSTEVCAFMQCQSIIELHLLTDKEAWSLFTSYANITDAYSEALKGVARKIVNHCKGLPIAIVTVGSTLRGKTIEEFELALSRLEDSKPLDIPRGFTSPHVCLELSYINLTNQLSKSLLLLCSIFPEDYEIDLEDLFRFGRGLGITGKFGTLEEARREMHVAITSLRNSCLLMNSNKKERVKMHDMVRDVALWIASKTGQEILASAKMDPRVLVEDEIMKDKKAIALWGLKKDQVLGDYKINCPTLEILLVCEEVGFNVSDACLESLERLKILAILNLPWRTRYSKSTLPLPVSLKSLQNLQTLCLRGYKLGNISVLESLQALEILDLRGSIFEELPIGIVDLKKLKLLDLYYCQIEKNNAYEVVGKCLRLEELYLYFIQFVDDFPRNVSFSRLQRYSIIIQGKFSILEDFVHNRSMEQLRPSRALCIERFQRFISPLNDLFIRADYLYLKYFEGDYQNVIPSMDPKGMNQLIVLKLHSCPVIECLYDSTIIRNNINMLQTEVVFSSLVKLRLSQLDSLRELFRDPNFRCSLKNLEELLIAGCKQLNNISFPRNSKLCNLKLLIIGGCPLPTSLFMPSVVQTLLLLEVLEISSCTSLRHIIEEVEEGNADFSSTRNHSSLTFPKLRTLLIERCEKLEYIFSVFLAQGLVNLESVKVLSNSKLKYVFGSEKEHNYHYQSFQQTNTGRNLPNLDTLELMNLPNLENEILWLTTITFNQLDDPMFCPQFKAVLKLRVLRLTDLRVKGLFQFQMEEQGSNRELAPFNLGISDLKLVNLPNLNFIWEGPTVYLSLQKLGSICVNGCPKLKIIFSTTIVRSLPMLTSLVITNSGELAQIFDIVDAQELKSLSCLQQVCFPSLSTISIKKCNKLEWLFYDLSATHFTHLTKLEIEECSQLHKVFAFEHEADGGGEEGTGKVEEQVLQKLRDIRLKNLPKFKEIHHGFKLEDDVEQTLEDCPKYSPSLYLHSDM